MWIRQAALLLLSIAISPAIAPAWAQVAGEGEPGTKPLVLTIRPSRADAEDPRARQDRLMRRLEQSDYWVRSICTHCGDSWKHQIYAPFNPMDALGSGGADRRAAE